MSHLFFNLILNPVNTFDTIDPIPHPPLQKSRPKRLTRDQRRDCQLLRSIGWKYQDIHRHTGHSYHQIQYACSGKATPKKSSGRPPILTQVQIEELVDFVCALRENRRMSYEKIAQTLNLGVKKQAIHTPLEREGFHRRLAMRKPPISEKNRLHRLR